MGRVAKIPSSDLPAHPRLLFRRGTDKYPLLIFLGDFFQRDTSDSFFLGSILTSRLPTVTLCAARYDVGVLGPDNVLVDRNVFRPYRTMYVDMFLDITITIEIYPVIDA